MIIGTVSPIEFNSGLRQLGNASLDYLNLALVIETQRKLEATVNEFIMTYDPKKMYRGIKCLNTNTVGAILNCYA